MPRHGISGLEAALETRKLRRYMHGITRFLTCCFLSLALQAADKSSLGPWKKRVVGNVQLSLEGHLMDVQGEVPLLEILGFDSEPADATERALEQRALTLLKKAELIIVPDPRAECSVVESKAAFRREGEDGLNNQFEVPRPRKNVNSALLAYRFSCRQPERLSSADFPLFNTFPNVIRLRVSVIPAKTPMQELNAKQSVLVFAH